MVKDSYLFKVRVKKLKRGGHVVEIVARGQGLKSAYYLIDKLLNNEVVHYQDTRVKRRVKKREKTRSGAERIVVESVPAEPAEEEKKAEEAGEEVPDFVKDNPWLRLLSKR